LPSQSATSNGLPLSRMGVSRRGNPAK